MFELYGMQEIVRQHLKCLNSETCCEADCTTYNKIRIEIEPKETIKLSYFDFSEWVDESKLPSSTLAICCTFRHTLQTLFGCKLHKVYGAILEFDCSQDFTR